MKFAKAQLAPLLYWVEERENIRVKKTAGSPGPWTRDPILAGYRFCNVRRNDDKQTVLIHTNWLQPHYGEDDLWFAMVVARLVNWWPSLQAVGFPVPWDARRFVKAMDARKERGEKVFTGAYMIHADAHHRGTKAAYLAEGVLTPMWKDRAKIRPREVDTLADFHRRLLGYRDMGSFMAAQVVADVKYDITGPLSRATDWWGWAAEGPGSMRGLSRLVFGVPDHKWGRGEWLTTFNELYNTVSIPIDDILGAPITAQDLQNCLCEVDKYLRVKNGEGKPRSKYQPS